VAVGVARVALRPLRAAAGTLATIDDRTLDRRLDAASLPVEIRPVGERMNQLLERLERGIGERKRFLADAAHELRTPVTALTTTIEVALRRPRDAASLAGTLRDCLSDARLLRRLVEMLLEQFRLDTNPGAAAVVETDVSALLDLCADAAGTAAKVKGVRVVRSYEAGVRFLTQPERLRSVVGNLLCNGIEYNVPGGEVEVTCEVTEGGGLSVGVRDTGPGIAPSERGRVFEPFYRPGAGAAAAGSCGEGHSGLGLYLVRAHVQALGGTCRLESPEGGGSEFRIDLPRPPGARGGREVVKEDSDTHELLTHAR
jgi:two-component system OmpR family sensor kinase